MVFNKFKDHSKPNSFVPGQKRNDEYTGPIRVKLPRGREIIGIITQRVGAGRMFISCMDGKTRNCRVPGRLRRELWLREGDVVIVEPWEFDNEKGDVLFKYSKTAIEKLKKDGLLKTSESEF